MTLVPRTDGTETRYLLPEEIITDPIYDVRPGEAEDDDIEELAQSIEANGQEDTGIVSANQVGGASGEIGDYYEIFTLIAGHRRRRAISLINTKKSALGEPLLKMRVYIDRTITSAAIGLRKAITNNLHRKGYTPMQVALLIERVKKENGWDKQGFKGTKLAAEYLGVNAATITQHEKFLKAPEEVKSALASGEISAQGALLLLTDVKPEKRKEVIEKAREMQAEVEAKKPGKKLRMEVISESGITEITESFLPEEDEKPGKKSSKAAKPTRVEAPALRKAARETPEATAGPLPLTKKEILQHLQDIADAPAYGFPDGDVRQWAKYFVEEFATGRGTERKLLNKFDKLCIGASEGTEKSSKAEEEKPAAPARATRKDAGKPKSEKAEKSSKPPTAAKKKATPKTK